MILPFSTKLNGKPTYFVEKIHSGIIEHLDVGIDGIFLEKSDINKSIGSRPKIHTIREDKNNRWQVGTKIHFFINARQKDMFQFAPVLPVVSVQKFEIVYYNDRETLMNDLPLKKAIAINEKRLPEDKWLELAQNDGFDTVEAFFEYFNDDFEGKLIHWTDKRY
jgi:hypothetical protein